MSKDSLSFIIPSSVILKTDRLTLRPYTLEDAKQVFKIATKYPDLPKHMTWNSPKKLEETLENYYQGLKKTDHCGFAIEYEGEFIGRIDLTSIEWKVSAADVSQATLGYWLHPEHHGQGLMTEAVKAVVQFGAQDLNLRRINARCFTVNPGSKRVLEKSGFREIGTTKQYFYKNGNLYDEHVFEFINKNWKPNE